MNIYFIDLPSSVILFVFLILWQYVQFLEMIEGYCKLDIDFGGTISTIGYGYVITLDEGVL